MPENDGIACLVWAAEISAAALVSPLFGALRGGGTTARRTPLGITLREKFGGAPCNPTPPVLLTPTTEAVDGGTVRDWRTTAVGAKAAAAAAEISGVFLMVAEVGRNFGCVDAAVNAAPTMGAPPFDVGAAAVTVVVGTF